MALLYQRYSNRIKPGEIMQPYKPQIQLPMSLLAQGPLL